MVVVLAIVLAVAAALAYAVGRLLIKYENLRDDRDRLYDSFLRARTHLEEARQERDQAWAERDRVERMLRGLRDSTESMHRAWARKYLADVRPTPRQRAYDLLLVLGRALCRGCKGCG